MANFAEIDKNGKVLRVLVINKEIIDSGKFGDPSNWIKTSFNTIKGKRKDNHKVKQPLRKNFAGIGYIYDDVRDAFIAEKPNYESWLLNEDTCVWEAPIPKPTDPKYKRALWDEENQTWVSKKVDLNRYTELNNKTK